MATVKPYKVTQGNSFGIDISCSELGTFDANFTGLWAIVEALDDKTDGDDIVTLAEGTMDRSSDDTKFELRILPAETNPIPVGGYMLIAQISNTVLGYSQEVLQRAFTITPQGI